MTQNRVGKLIDMAASVMAETIAVSARHEQLTSEVETGPADGKEPTERIKLEVGAKIGELTVYEISGDKVHCRCSCNSGRNVVRKKRTMTLTRSQVLISAPKCKQCQKKNHKKFLSHVAEANW